MLAPVDGVDGGGGADGWGGAVIALAVGVVAGLPGSCVSGRGSAGLLLSGLAVCLSWLFSLSLLATARGGASFLGP